MMKEYSGHDNPSFIKERQPYFQDRFNRAAPLNESCTTESVLEVCKNIFNGFANMWSLMDSGIKDNHVTISVEEGWHNTITYSWHKINVFAKPERGLFKGKHRLKEEKQILKDVTGICRPGELVAIMGASGAGKTTLLNVLTSRTGKNLRVEGNLFLNGQKMSMNDLTKRSAYVQQEDLFIGTMTVKEQLVFQASLRMDRHIPRNKRMARVNEVIQELGLLKCKNTLIGDPGRIKGISGGETKRLAFACEVLTDPPLMFCDEPTSGLDSFMAQNIVSAMKNLAGRGKSIITTIHQPSSEVFAMFDRVLLMAEGRLAFLGLTSDALKFFSGLGKTCPLNFNPADFFISTLAIRPEHEEECRAFVSEVCDTFKDSQNTQAILEATKANMKYTKELQGESKSEAKRRQSPYKAGWMIQFLALIKRGFLEMAREPMLFKIKVVQTIMVSLLVGLIYLDTSGNYTQASVQNLNGCLFIMVTNLSFQFCFGVVNIFCSQLPIFLREHYNGMYRTDIFFITKNLAELPSSLILPLIFLLVSYFMVNIYRDAATFFTIFGVLVLTSNTALSYGYLISCLASNLRMALAIAAPMLIPFMIFGGFFLNSDTVPVYFIWLQYISWFNYGNEAMIIAQWKNVEEIEYDEDTMFYYRNGTEVIQSLGYNENNLWIDFVALVALIVLYRTLAFLALLRRAYTGF